MELNFEISEYVKDKLGEFNSSAALTDQQREEIVLMINSAFSDGKSKGARNASILSNKIGPYLNR